MEIFQKKYITQKECLSSKQDVRSALRNIRDNLSEARRQEAAASTLKLIDTLSFFEVVLSFSSFGSEIDLSLVNHYLLRTNKLVFPKMAKTGLELYRVSNLHKHLVVNNFGLKEPNPLTCQKVDTNQIQIALIPGLGFDKSLNRLGYGKGFYDRIIEKFSPAAPTIGIGFQEQLLDSLPIEKTDKPLSEIALF